MKIVLLTVFALQTLAVNAAVVKSMRGPATPKVHAAAPPVQSFAVLVHKKAGGRCECTQGKIKRACPCDCQPTDAEFKGPEVLDSSPRCQPGVHIRKLPCDCFTAMKTENEAEKVVSEVENEAEKAVQEVEQEIGVDAGPVSTDPRVWPKNGSSEAAPVREVEEDITEQEKTIEKNEKKGDLWELILCWVVLIALTLFLRQRLKSKAYRPSDRAPYMAFLIILWTITFFATFFYFFCSHGWTWVQCVYFTVVTVTTVGYGDLVPEDNLADKLMLLVLLWGNMAVLSVVLGLVCTKEEDAIEGQSKAGQFKRLLGFVLGLVFLGAFVFMYMEGWNFLEGVTFTTVTLTTVGYGYLLPNSSPHSMILASIFMLFGVPVTGSFVGTLGGMIDDKFKDKKAKMGQSQLLGAYVGLIIGWLFIGAFGFFITTDQGWTLSECAYVAAVTMTTVGYGDYVPTKGTVIAHLFVIAYIWGSVVVIATVFGDLDTLLMDDLTKGMNKHKGTVTRMGVLGGLIAVGMVMFAFIENWGALSGLIFTSVTCTTVGYGHLLPSGAAGRLFATFFILISVPLTGSLVSSVSGNYSDEISTLIADMD